MWLSTKSERERAIAGAKTQSVNMTSETSCMVRSSEIITSNSSREGKYLNGNKSFQVTTGNFLRNVTLKDSPFEGVFINKTVKVRHPVALPKNPHHWGLSRIPLIPSYLHQDVYWWDHDYEKRRKSWIMKQEGMSLDALTGHRLYSMAIFPTIPLILPCCLWCQGRKTLASELCIQVGRKEEGKHQPCFASFLGE